MTEKGRLIADFRPEKVKDMTAYFLKSSEPSATNIQKSIGQGWEKQQGCIENNKQNAVHLGRYVMHIL